MDIWDLHAPGYSRYCQKAIAGFLQPRRFISPSFRAERKVVRYRADPTRARLRANFRRSWLLFGIMREQRVLSARTLKQARCEERVQNYPKDSSAEKSEFMQIIFDRTLLTFFLYSRTNYCRDIFDRSDVYHSRNILLHLTKLRNIWHVCCNSRMNARDERIALELDGC